MSYDVVATYVNFSSRALYDKRISNEVLGEDLGEEFAGYVSLMATLVYIALSFADIQDYWWQR